MKKIILTLCLIISSLISTTTIAQKGSHHHHAKRHHHHHSNQKVYRSKHRPAVIVVYRPHWSPKRDYHRRWVYFPVHRMYWDNWRQVYFYHNGRRWVSSKALPSHMVNIKLETENHYELEESMDDDDEIYEHQETIEEEK